MAAPNNNVLIEDFYPYSFTPFPRYGEGKPGHPRIEKVLRNGLPRYESLLNRFKGFIGALLQVGLRQDPAAPQLPNWIKRFPAGVGWRLDLRNDRGQQASADTGDRFRQFHEVCVAALRGKERHGVSFWFTKRVGRHLDALATACGIAPGCFD